VVRKPLRAGADINASSFYNGTPFHLASRNGYDVVVQRLLKAGADNNARYGRYSKVPLHWASENGHDAVALQLLDSSADMNAKCRHLDLGRLKNRFKERSYDD